MIVPVFPWEVVILSLFYTALFLVVCSFVASCICRVIHEIYASKTTMIKLISDGQASEQLQAVNERIAKALAEEHA